MNMYDMFVPYVGYLACALLNVMVLSILVNVSATSNSAASSSLNGRASANRARLQHAATSSNSNNV